MKKLFLLFQICILLTIPVLGETPTADSYNGGAGTIENPYQLATLSQLRRLSETDSDWGKYFILTSDINASDTRTWNIVGLDTLGFEGIGNSILSFTGLMDGNGFVIDSIYRNGVSQAFVGMFGIASGATIKNLGLTNCRVKGLNWVGGLAGECNSGSEVYNCYITGQVRSTGNTVGGMFGFVSGSTVEKCYSTCAVKGVMNVGGFVGIIKNDGIIRFSFVTGNVIASSYRGGFAGQLQLGRIDTCYATGIVTGSGSTTGAMIGTYTLGEITSSYYDMTNNPSIQAVGNVSNGNIQGITTAAFAQEESFTGWDFGSVWYIETIGSIDIATRPYLRWQINDATLKYTWSNGGSVNGKTTQYLMAWETSLPVTALPETGYTFEGWYEIVEDEYVPFSTTNPLVINAPQVDRDIFASFQINTYLVNFYSTGNNTLLGDTSQTIEHGGSTTAVEAIPSDNYHFVAWQDGDGNIISTENPIIVLDITQDLNIIATFQINTYQVNFYSTGNNTFLGDTSQTIEHGGSTTAVEAIPSDNYHYVAWQDGDGNIISTENPIIVSDITQDINIIATVQLNTYLVNFYSTGNNTLLGDTSQTIEHGGSTTAVEAIPSDNYRFVAWQDGDGNIISTENPIIVSDVKQDIDLTATFEIITTLDEQVLNDFRYFPNPVNDVLNIRCESPAQIHLYAITGDLILSAELIKTLTTIDFSTINTGTYLIQIITDTSSETQLLLVE